MGAVFGLSKVDIWGRRFTVIVSCCCVAISWFGASVCAIAGGLETGKSELHFNSYLLRFGFGSFLCLFAFSYSFGIGIVAWIVPSELFPLRARAKASALTTSLRYATAIAVSAMIQHYYIISNSHAAVYGFVAFGTISLVMGCILTIILPETKGLTMLDDMETLFDMSGSWCCCFVDSKASIIGFRTINHHSVLTDLQQGSDNSSTGVVSASSPLFDPSYLHKYSGDMR
jgi:MFS family permease